MFFSTLVQLLVATSYVAATPLLTSRSVIKYDSVKVQKQGVPDGLTGDLYLKRKPYLDVNGCLPYPAVDADGNISGGLEPKGSAESDCEKSRGQVYARGSVYKDSYAIMYSWYFPKAMPKWTNPLDKPYRHDWQCIVVWLSSQSLDASIVGISYSTGKFYRKETSKQTLEPTLKGARPMVDYHWHEDLVAHEMHGTAFQGREQPLVAWERFTSAAKSALENSDFGTTQPPFTEKNFDNQLANAELPRKEIRCAIDAAQCA